MGKACHSLCGAIFLLKNDQFTETGSGQTWESVREKVFLQVRAVGSLRRLSRSEQARGLRWETKPDQTINSLLLATR
jgi:hypothetical protein